MKKTVALAMALPLLAAPVLAASPASAQDIVKRNKLEKNIENGFKQQRNINVNAKCPSKVTWVKGKVFNCKVVAGDGSRARIEVTLKSNATKGRLTWKLL